MPTSLSYQGPASSVVQIPGILDPNGFKTPRHATEFNVVLPKTLTVSIAAYSAGMCVGGLLQFTNAARGSEALSMKIRGAVIIDQNNQQGTYDLAFFDSNPITDSTIANHATPTIGRVDGLRGLGFVTINSWCLFNASSLGQGLLDNPITLASGNTTLYAVLITRGTPTFAATDDIAIKLLVGRE